MRNLLYATVLGFALACSGCSNFLEDQVPQGTIDNEQLQNPAYVDNLGYFCLCCVDICGRY